MYFGVAVCFRQDIVWLTSNDGRLFQISGAHLCKPTRPMALWAFWSMLTIRHEFDTSAACVSSDVDKRIPQLIPQHFQTRPAKANVTSVSAQLDLGFSPSHQR